ncbi:MAG TPA: hypothetical protein P5180_01405 [Bacteroidales bacterium]|nr:hypothetical protein [Bacteroidales bacterium]HPF01731.1 hypothetical protein [Bacteroidales bacterium]HPJ59749.1 hypothetical protein [Bacteroidales bacterium]HRW84062.1 hypothetical protein [Bacteroidales bacterium]
MESSDEYNFSIFRPRNLHGRKNRNIIFTMLLIWATAVFGFQILLKVVEKPVPEKAYVIFESEWPVVLSGSMTGESAGRLMRSFLLVKGKNIVSSGDQKILSGAVNTLFYAAVPDSVEPVIINQVAKMKEMKAKLATVRDQEYLSTSSSIVESANLLSGETSKYSGFENKSLETSILVNCLSETYQSSFSEEELSRIPDIMSLYLIHNQSKLTDKHFLGFPFHYFYTAVFLLILFVSLCIVYNILVEWRLNKQGVVE